VRVGRMEYNVKKENKERDYENKKKPLETETLGKKTKVNFVFNINIKGKSNFISS
jgi:hypothetical protein